MKGGTHTCINELHFDSMLEFLSHGASGVPLIWVWREAKLPQQLISACRHATSVRRDCGRRPRSRPLPAAFGVFVALWVVALLDLDILQQVLLFFFAVGVMTMSAGG